MKPSSPKKIARAFFVVLLFPFIAFGQKLNKPITDKFTNDSLRFTSFESIAFDNPSGAGGVNLFCSFIKGNNGIVCLNLQVVAYQSDFTAFFNAGGNSVMIKLADNSILTLTDIRGVLAVPPEIQNNGFTNGLYSAHFLYALSSQDISRIKASWATDFRVTSNKQIMDFALKPKGGDMFAALLALIVDAK
ncbi:hypothetical protein HDF24_24025 [Mucilaginibacter sp. X4EP1]|uniref:hypothetical protein n=1 Tax=Mucilaginibacter sp. X4EP1 TaxID=2723092 RepID=UPI0021692D35|nr:hypothetical protein [Mucilaginibacter sp. X4EP1]MCS3816161.1 hypothetical protein [Mucilaginibacter sp. X4EP1]